MKPRLVIAAVATLALTAVVAVAAGLLARPAPVPREPAESRLEAAPQPDAGHQPVEGRRRREPRARSRDGQRRDQALAVRRHRALRVVRKFLAAYLPLEVADVTSARRRTVARTVTDRLGQRILSAPARPLASGVPDAGKVVGVTGELDKPPARFAARVLIDRDGRVNELGLSVREKGGRWLIDALTE